MSCKVLVIPEDPTYNGYLLKPLTERVLAEAGRPNAQVLVLRDPKTGGFTQACELIENGKLQDRYGYYDLWLFLPDGDQTRSLQTLEAGVQNQKAKLIASYLTPEVEVTLIAGHPKADVRGWQEKKQLTRFKEEVFEPFLASNGNPTAPGEGRGQLMLEALTNYQRMKQLVPELTELERRITETLANR